MLSQSKTSILLSNFWMVCERNGWSSKANSTIIIEKKIEEEKNQYKYSHKNGFSFAEVVVAQY